MGLPQIMVPKNIMRHKTEKKKWDIFFSFLYQWDHQVVTSRVRF